MNRKASGGILFVLSGVTLLLGMNPPYLPLTYPDSVQGSLSVVAILLGIAALYLVATSQLRAEKAS